jgi:hypothetical protein
MRENQALGYRVYEPTRQDIELACKEIQATWSPRARAKRATAPSAAWWVPPAIRLSTLVEATGV